MVRKAATAPKPATAPPSATDVHATIDRIQDAPLTERGRYDVLCGFIFCHRLGLCTDLSDYVTLVLGAGGNTYSPWLVMETYPPVVDLTDADKVAILRTYAEGCSDVSFMAFLHQVFADDQAERAAAATAATTTKATAKAEPPPPPAPPAAVEEVTETAPVSPPPPKRGRAGPDVSLLEKRVAYHTGDGKRIVGRVKSIQGNTVTLLAEGTNETWSGIGRTKVAEIPELRELAQTLPISRADLKRVSDWVAGKQHVAGTVKNGEALFSLTYVVSERAVCYINCQNNAQAPWIDAFIYDPVEQQVLVEHPAPDNIDTRYTFDFVDPAAPPDQAEVRLVVDVVCRESA